MNAQQRQEARVRASQVFKCHRCGKTFKGNSKEAVFLKGMVFCCEDCYDMAYYHAIGKKIHI